VEVRGESQDRIEALHERNSTRLSFHSTFLFDTALDPRQKSAKEDPENPWVPLFFLWPGISLRQYVS